VPSELLATWVDARRLLALAAGLLSPAMAAADSLPPSITLEAAERSRVLAGKTVFFYSPENPPRAGIAFRVAAGEACIWSVIGDLAAYARRVTSLDESSVYRADAGETCVRFRASNWLAGTYRYSTCHRFPWPDDSWGSFQLDPEEDNDFVSASGFWRTEALPDGDSSLVYYVAEVTPRGGIAGLFQKQFVRRGLKTATQWLPEAVAAGDLPACSEPADVQPN
jgi:hypothetical protein